jgi:molybdopterin synthase catalytic subunit
LRAQTLDASEVLSAVGPLGHGAKLLFEGVIRPEEDGRPIAAIVYEAYPEMAEREAARIVAEVEARRGVRAAVRHRIGRVPAGETSLLAAAWGTHREEAFAACRELVDLIKSRVPVWKSEFEWL